jgi:two-component sensor histidine kinase
MLRQKNAALTWSLLALLLAYGALATLPIIAVGGYLLFRVVQAEQAHLQERVHQVAAAVAGDVERELQRRVVVLATLATSPLIAQKDFAGFQTQARAAVANDDLGVLLHDAIGKQQLVNTLADRGAPLPTTGDPETFDRVLSTKRVQISNLFDSLVTKKPAIDIAFPILEDGQVRYLLKLALTPEHFWQIIAEHALDLQWKVTIVDRRGFVIACSDEHDRGVGRRLPADQLDEMQGQKPSATTRRNGEPIMTAWARVPSAQWLVRVSVPFGVAQAPLNRSMAWLAAAAVLALVATLLLGIAFAARISEPLKGIARMAQGLVRHEPGVAAPASYKEANILRASLTTAAEELAQLRNRERLVVHESRHRIMNILAVVRSLVQQTLDGERMGEARNKLMQRLEALGRAQDALITSDREGTPFDQVVAAELAHHADRVTLQGPSIVIRGSAVQTLSLLIHELGTNAAKYGALSNADGRVSVTWSHEDLGGASRLRFRWQESGGPTVKPPDTRGFGSTLLEAAAIGGESLVTYQPSGLVYEFEAPIPGMAASSGG